VADFVITQADCIYLLSRLSLAGGAAATAPATPLLGTGTFSVAAGLPFAGAAGGLASPTAGSSTHTGAISGGPAPFFAPAEFSAITFGHIAPDGSLENIGLLEQACRGRILELHRGATSGAARTVMRYLAPLFEELGETAVVRGTFCMPQIFTCAKELGQEFGQIFVKAQAPLSLQRFPDGIVAAVREVVNGLSTAKSMLTESNIAFAVDQDATLITLIGGGAFCKIGDIDIWTQIHVLAGAVGIVALPLNLGHLSVISHKLTHLRVSFATSARQSLSPAERCYLVVTLLADCDNELKLAPKVDTALSGYSRSMQGALQA